MFFFRHFFDLAKNSVTGTTLPRLVLRVLVIGSLFTMVTSAQAAVLPLEGTSPGDFNGTRVDISGDTILVGGCCGGAGQEGWA